MKLAAVPGGARCAGRRGQRGFTLLELVVAICVIAALAAVLLTRLRYYQEFAEKTAMELTAQNMRTGLRFRLGELVAKQDKEAIARLAGENPVNWLERPPPNYVGELRAPGHGAVPPGSWYFDAGARQIVYRLNRSAHFASGQPGQPPEVRFRVAIWPAGADKAEWARLEPVQAYSWF